MNILITSVGTRGDVDPFLVLGAKLQEQGHTIYFFTANVYKTLVTTNGFNYIEVLSNEDYTEFLNDENSYNAKSAFKSVAKYFVLKPMRATFYAMGGFASSDCMIISSPLMIGAKLASEVFGIKMITVSLQPIAYLSSEKPSPFYSGLNILAYTPRLLRKFIFYLIKKLVTDPQITAKIDDFRSEIKLPLIKHDFRKWFFLNTFNIALFPSWFAAPASDWPNPVNLSGFVHLQNRNDKNLDSTVMDFINNGESPILVTFGTGMKNCRSVLQTSLDIARQLNKRIILLTSFKEQVPVLNPEMELHIGYANMNQLLNHVCVFIHHGGIGTSALALSHEVPQLIIPLLFDQPDNALKLSNLGCALTLSLKEFTVNNGAKYLTKLLNDEQIKASCAKYAKMVNFAANEKNIIETILTFSSAS